MARIKYGGIVTDISGSIGGTTFQKSIFGNTLRTKPIPLKKASAAQLIIRAHMMTIHNAWRGLTPAARLQWNRFINYSGQSIRRDSAITMTGHDLFIKYNIFRLISNLDLFTIPSYSAMPQSVALLRIVKGTNLLKLVFASSVNPASLWFIFKVSYSQLPSLAFTPQSIRHLKVTPTASAEFNVASLYIAVFGLLPPVGATVHYSIQFFSTTAPVYTSKITGLTVLLAP